MSIDDCIRRDIIKQLICHFHLNKSEFSERYSLNFDQYFADDLALLKPLENDGLIRLQPNLITVTPKGRLLIRNICMCFDVYYRNTARQQQFSRVI